MSKKILIVATIVIVIILGIICGVALNKKTEANNKNIENELSENETFLNEETINEVTNVIVNEEKENIAENVVENIQENSSTETFEENPKTLEEKAIQIAKKDYGNGENIKFGVEGIDESGRYIVTVRDANTTEALVFYFVNVSNSTFTKREMN